MIFKQNLIAILHMNDIGILFTVSGFGENLMETSLNKNQAILFIEWTGHS